MLSFAAFTLYPTHMPVRKEVNGMMKFLIQFMLDLVESLIIELIKYLIL